MSAAVIAALTLVGDTNVVLRLFPWKYTTDPLTKPEPFTVSVNATPPIAVLVGLKLEMLGAPAATVPLPWEL